MEHTKVPTVTELKHHFYDQLATIKKQFENMECGCYLGFRGNQICEFCAFRDKTLSSFDRCLNDLAVGTDWRSKFERNAWLCDCKFENLNSLYKAGVLYSNALNDVKRREDIMSINCRECYELALSQIEEFLDSSEELPDSLSDLVI